MHVVDGTSIEFARWAVVFALDIQPLPDKLVHLWDLDRRLLSAPALLAALQSCTCNGLRRPAPEGHRAR